MDDWLSKITNWFLGLVRGVFDALGTWIHDAVLWAFDGILQAIAGLVSAIPMPAFLSSGINIGAMFSAFPPFALYVISHLGLAPAFAVISAAILFRLTRVFLTGFQWT